MKPLRVATRIALWLILAAAVYGAFLGLLVVWNDFQNLDWQGLLGHGALTAITLGVAFGCSRLFKRLKDSN